MQYPGSGAIKIKKRKKQQPVWDPFKGMPTPRRGIQGAASFAGKGMGGLFGMSQPRFGGGPDYSGLIGGSADLSGLEAEFGAASAADAAARDAAIRRFVISYGQVPDFSNLGISKDALSYLNKALDPKTRELAAKAEAEGLSIHARQAKEDATARRRIPAHLAGRGMLRSGQTGFDLGEQAQNYKIMQYDTLNELLGGIEGTVSNFAAAERDRAMQLAMARMNAAWDAYDQWGGDLGGPTGPGNSAASYPGRPRINGSAPRTGVSKAYLRKLGRYPGARRTPNVLGGFSAY